MRGGSKDLRTSEAQSGRRRERQHGGFTARVGRRGGEHGTDKRPPYVCGG
jgi:hypothetical protein